MDTEGMKKYQDYLKRLICNKDLSIREAHQLRQSRLVAEEYGLTPEQIEWLDNNL